MGTQDSLKLAQNFRKRHKMSSVRMLWDRTGRSWRQLGIPAQPGWMVIDTKGEIIGANLGGIPYKAVLDAI